MGNKKAASHKIQAILSRRPTADNLQYSEQPFLPDLSEKQDSIRFFIAVDTAGWYTRTSCDETYRDRIHEVVETVETSDSCFTHYRSADCIVS